MYYGSLCLGGLLGCTRCEVLPGPECRQKSEAEALDARVKTDLEAAIKEVKAPRVSMGPILVSYFGLPNFWGPIWGPILGFLILGVLFYFWGPNFGGPNFLGLNFMGPSVYEGSHYFGSILGAGCLGV